MNETVKIVLACPRCGNTTWIPREDGYECAACGEFCYPEDMGSAVQKIEEG